MVNLKDRPVVIVGAGIVGLCCAYYLRKAGKQVLLVDKSLPGTGCSFGNSGAISENSITPIGMPGVMKQAPGMLINPESPLSVPLNYMMKAAPWLYAFVKSSTIENVTRTADILAAYLAGSTEQHTKILKEIGAIDLLQSGGQLHVYRTEESLNGDSLSWRLRSERGLKCERVNRQQLLDLEPALSNRYHAGIFCPDQSWLSDPYEYCKRLLIHLLENGCHFVHSELADINKYSDGWKVSLNDGLLVYADDVIVCAGVTTRNIMERLGTKLPLISQRGYHVHTWSPDVKINRIIALSDRKAFVCPMGDSIRIGGTVEFQDPDYPPNDTRAMHLANHLASALDGVNIQHSTRWMGNRPCSPDSIPLIGSPKEHPGLWYATGHGHLGLTGSANTGRLITESILSKRLAPLLAPLSVERFSA
jgi:D-amino-acid dehydrogenase